MPPEKVASKMMLKLNSIVKSLFFVLIFALSNTAYSLNFYSELYFYFKHNGKSLPIQPPANNGVYINSNECAPNGRFILSNFASKSTCTFQIVNQVTEPQGGATTQTRKYYTYSVIMNEQCQSASPFENTCTIQLTINQIPNAPIESTNTRTSVVAEVSPPLIFACMNSKNSNNPLYAIPDAAIAIVNVEIEVSKAGTVTDASCYFDYST